MIERCLKKSDEETIIRYIGNDVTKCLYLYADLKRYGIESDQIRVFVQKDEAETAAVFLIYHSCLHVYSRGNRFDALEALQFFADEQISMIYCEARTCLCFWNLLSEKENYTLSFGNVGEITRIEKYNAGLCESLKTGEFKIVADMLFRDESIGTTYQYDDLLEQLERRANEGFTRNFVVKENGQIIAHACTNAEIENLAVVGELIVSEEYRRRGYATDIWKNICGALLDEGMRVYSFYFSEESKAFHHKMGFIDVCQWGKIVRTSYGD